MKTLRFALMSVGTLMCVLTCSAAENVQPGAAVPPADQNLVLAAPITTWDEAVPLGNGLLGGLLWGEKNTLRLSLDRGDLWDERPAGEKEWWKKHTYAMGKQLVDQKKFDVINGLWDSPYNGVTPTKLPAGRMEITLDAAQQVKTFELNLATAEGVARFTNGTKLDAFFSAAEPVVLLRIPGPEPKAIRTTQPDGCVSPTERRQHRPQQRRHRGRAWISRGQDRQRGRREMVRSTGSRWAGVLCLHGIPSRRQRDAGGRDRHLYKRRRRPARLGTSSAVRSALARGYEAMLKPHADWWRKFWMQSSVSVPEPEIQRHYVLCRYFYGAASRRGAPPDALAGRLDGRLRRIAAVEGRLPQRPQHANDVYRLSWRGELRRGRVVPRFPLAAQARFREVRTRLLRHARTGLPRRHVAGRPAARRLGTVQSVAHHERLERASVLPPLALHDG